MIVHVGPRCPRCRSGRPVMWRGVCSACCRLLEAMGRAHPPAPARTRFDALVAVGAAHPAHSPAFEAELRGWLETEP